MSGHTGSGRRADAAIPFEREELDGTLPERFRRVVAAVPQRDAIVAGGRTLTYAGLDAEAARLAASLRDVPPGAVVGLVFGIGIDAIVALLGAFNAGVPVLPIDPAVPPDGLTSILAGLDRLLTDPAHADWCRDRAGGLPVHVGIPTAVPGDLRLPRPDDPAVIYLTSASSGPPKGVIRTHRSLCWHAGLQTRHHGYGPGDRVAHISSFAFAGSVPAILGALMSGATLEAFDIRARGVTALGAWAAERGITVLPVTTSLLRDVAESRRRAHDGWQPRRIIIGGEAVRPDDIALIRDRLGWSTVIVNRLASSEAGMIAEWEVDAARLAGTDTLPVGWPVEDRSIVIVDEAGAPVPAGMPGEIVVCGDYLSAGYWRRPDLTAQAFRPDPLQPARLALFSGDLGRLHADGLLDHLGRADQLVKVRGYRVELAAVEAALRAVEGVAEAVVQAVTTGTGDVRLAAWVQRQDGASMTGFALRQTMLRRLPDYMVPWRIGVLDALPRTAGGKVARSGLPPLRGDRPDGLPPCVAPANDIETLLASIWSDVLEVDEIGREDDFLELGGDSLDMVHVAAKLYETLTLFITDSELMENPRLADMAAAIARSAAEAE